MCFKCPVMNLRFLFAQQPGCSLPAALQEHSGVLGWAFTLSLPPGTSAGFQSWERGRRTEPGEAGIHLAVGVGLGGALGWGTGLFSVSAGTERWLHRAPFPALLALVLAEVTRGCWGLPAQDSRSLSPGAAGSVAPEARVCRERAGRDDRADGATPALFVRLLSWAPEPLGKPSSPRQAHPAAAPMVRPASAPHGEARWCRGGTGSCQRFRHGQSRFCTLEGPFLMNPQEGW